MSKGIVCKCPDANRRDNWRVVQYKCNHSAFNGCRYTPSNYSSFVCLTCRTTWRTKAKYVEEIKMLKRGEWT